ALERVAARKSRELQNVLGGVLRGLQSDGLVLVTLERQQPVYHLTIARSLDRSIDSLRRPPPRRGYTTVPTTRNSPTLEPFLRLYSGSFNRRKIIPGKQR